MIFQEFTGINLIIGTSSLSLIALFLKFVFDQVKNTITFSYEKQKLAYDISMNSNIAYDLQKKNISFCEEYINEVHNITHNLFRDGYTKETLKYSYDLDSIRKKYTLYIPEKVYNELYNFEYVLRSLGAAAGYEEAVRNIPKKKSKRSESIKKSRKLFMQLIDKNNKDVDREIMNTEEILSHIRDTVGINHLYSLKREILSK